MHKDATEIRVDKKAVDMFRVINVK